MLDVPQDLIAREVDFNDIVLKGPPWLGWGHPRLVNAEGRVVAGAIVYGLPSHGHSGCGCDGEGRDEAGEQEPEAWAQWSTDRGRTWYALATNLRGDSASIDARALPSGRVRIRLLVSDGFYTAVSRSLNVTVPRRPPEATVLSPREGQTFISNSPMRLWGAATDSGGTPVPDDAARWSVDGAELATGFDAFVEAPKPGNHRATLTIKSRGGSAETTVGFVTVELPEERDEG